MTVHDTASTATPRGTAFEVFVAFLRLGLTSFGGPVAHLGYFRQDIVERRRWLDERSYPISSRCASSCPARRRAKSGSASA